ncbi:MAG: diphthine synthase [Thermoplasmata archaeon]
MGKIYFIGLGLFDEKDISLKGLEAVRSCERVFAEFYTAFLAGTSIEKLESLYGKKIEVLSREEVESGNKIIENAKGCNVAFLTAGDAMTATTHQEIRLRALDLGIETEIIHGSSIVTSASGLLGLQHYKFGKTTTIPFKQKGYFPTSPYDAIRDNLKMGLHTLVLLDIQVSKDSARYMSANEGLRYLHEIEDFKKEGIATKDRLVCVVSRAGSRSPVVRAGRLGKILEEDFGPPLHSIVIPGKLHFLEAESLVKIAGAPKEILE